MGSAGFIVLTTAAGGSAEDPDEATGRIEAASCHRRRTCEGGAVLIHSLQGRRDFRKLVDEDPRPRRRRNIICGRRSHATFP